MKANNSQTFSADTLKTPIGAVLLVMVSISPVPKFEPGPVSYFQTFVSSPEPAGPSNSSLRNDCRSS